MSNEENKHVILIVEDEASMMESYKVLLEDKYKLLLASCGAEALEIIKKEVVDLVILDIFMPDMDGIEVLKNIKQLSEAEVIMITAVQNVRTAIDAVKLGAYDYIPKPFDIDDLLLRVSRAIEKQTLSKEILYLKSESKTEVFEEMVGRSTQMKQVFGLIQEVSKNRSTILISGESGTGKELAARAIHASGPNSNKPFVTVDCSSLPETICASELFGHEKGSSQYAISSKIGKFELAHTGTLFFDEVGNLPENIQIKLLRVLEERELSRIGSSKIIKIDVRIIAATNINLKKAVRKGSFRKDLYYRLNVIPISIPPLRDRKEDIPFLIEYFLKIFNIKFKKNIKGLSTEAMNMMMNFDWPGNVRELRNVIERMVVLSKGDTIFHERIPVDILINEGKKPIDSYDKISLRDAREEFEKQFILKILEKTNWNQTRAAELMGIHRNALLYKIHAFNLRSFIRQGKKGKLT